MYQPEKISDWEKCSLIGDIRLKVLAIFNRARKNDENFPVQLEDIFEDLNPVFEKIEEIIAEKLDEKEELIKAETYSAEEYEKLDKKNDRLEAENEEIKEELGKAKSSPKITWQGEIFTWCESKGLFVNWLGKTLALTEVEDCQISAARC